MGGMGFRDLKCFNQALLANQGWRLYGNESSSLHGIYKERYLKNSVFLEAMRGFDHSFSSRSIWEAKSLFLEGLEWRVGNGASIKVWEDLWFTGGVQFVPTPLQDSNIDLMVIDLLDAIKGCWNVKAVNSTFRKNERKHVLDIPLPSYLCTNSMYWWPTNDGNYYVKSGFWLARMGHLRTWELFNGQGERDLWRIVWNLDGSPKLRRFLRKACKRSLGVMDVLFKHHIHDSSVCPIGSDGDETIMHTLFDCKFATEVWMHSDFMGLFMEAPVQSFAARFSWVVVKLGKQELARFASLA